MNRFHSGNIACVSDLLSVSLKHVDRVNGRVSEVPQSEGGVSGRGDHQTLGGVCAAVGQLLVVACRTKFNILNACVPQLPLFKRKGLV